MRKRPTEFEQLISDYYRDNRTIKRMKYKWLEPRSSNAQVTKQVGSSRDGRNEEPTRDEVKEAGPSDNRSGIKQSK